MMQDSDAERIASRFGNDGLRFVDFEGTHLIDVCAAECVAWQRARSVLGEETAYVEVSKGEGVFDATRYEFPDGSAIVVAGDAWDIEGDEPFVWAGA
jgi:hypothetical protein